jgi:uncharacterized protein (TIGR02588 family)
MTVPHKNWLEWAVFAVSAALIVCVAALLAYEGITLERTPPLLEVRVGAPQPSGDQVIVPVEVSNDGGATAELVQVEVTMERGAEVERAMFELDFVPRGSSAEGWAMFSQAPGDGDRISARVIGFAQP